jgi:hypothetical protein
VIGFRHRRFFFPILTLIGTMSLLAISFSFIVLLFGIWAKFLDFVIVLGVKFILLDILVNVYDVCYAYFGEGNGPKTSWEVQNP